MRTGLPWKQGGPALSRFLDTARGVLLEPARRFATMRRTGGLQAPLVYAIAGGAVAALASAVCGTLLSSASPGLLGDPALALGPPGPMFVLMLGACGLFLAIDGR